MPPRVNLPASTVLSRLEYLDPSFDPSILTIPALTNVLQYHNVDTRAAGNKTALVALFEANIRPNASRLREQRKREMNMSPRAGGIRDGVTGELVEEPAASSRRVTRRTSRLPESPRPPSPGRRRSSIEPSPSVRASSSRTPATADVAEDEEPSTDEDTIPPPVSDRRQSLRNPLPRAEPTFTNENVFQRGSSSSPRSADEDTFPPARVNKPRASAPFTADAAPASTRRVTRSSLPATPREDPFVGMSASDSMRRRAVEGLPSPARRAPLFDETTESAEVELDTDDEGEVAEALLEDEEERPSTTPAFTLPKFNPAQLLLLLPLLYLLYYISWYKSSSAQIGYCTPGPDSRTNSILELRADQLARDRECHALNGEECRPMPILPYPSSCTPCPKNATCATPHSLTCDAPLVPRPRALGGLSFLDGLPGFGSVAFPPRCVEDLGRKRRVSGAGRWIEGYLASKRGQRVCEGKDVVAEKAGEAEWRWAGVRKEELKSEVRKLKAGKDMDEGQFEDVVANALVDLERLGMIFYGTDEAGDTWLASKDARMGTLCALRVHARHTWRAYRLPFAALLALLASLLYTRSRLSHSRHEAALAQSLIPAVLAALQTASLAHHTDPALNPSSAVPTSQLRDAVLAEEHSVARRKRIWERVERIVEGNANVRVAEEEVGGDVGRVWRWVGTGAGGSPRKLEAKY